MARQKWVVKRDHQRNFEDKSRTLPETQEG
jgi:hypothetical protein